MDYHEDRFEDYSLLIYRDEKLFGLLPANRKANTLHSHQGLTYGGFVWSKHAKFLDITHAVQASLRFLNEQGITDLYLNLLPTIYCKSPSQEIDYLLFLLQAKCIRVDLSSTISGLKHHNIQSSGRKDGLRKGIKNQLEIREDNKFKPFWKQVLVPQLLSTHNVKPVHTWQEIENLHQAFPEQIKQVNVYYKDKIVGGTTLFITDKVVHTQYIASNSQRQELGTLDYLFFYLIEDKYKEVNYFDFGISTTAQGKELNKGLLYWKEAFGGQAVAHKFYHISTETSYLLDSIL